LPRMQHTRAIPVAWLSSGLCPDRPKGWIPIPIPIKIPITITIIIVVIIIIIIIISVSAPSYRSLSIILRKYDFSFPLILPQQIILAHWIP
jgi:hypothetical protein